MENNSTQQNGDAGRNWSSLIKNHSEEAILDCGLPLGECVSDYIL